jgi:transposase-like protein
MARPQGSTGRRQLTTAERQRIRTLYFDANFTKAKIASITGATADQIRYTIRQESATVAPRSGRPKALTPEQESDLVEFVCATKKNRRMTFLQLSCVLFAGVFGMWAIKNTLYRLGFRRRVARKKPPISEENRVKRLNWALEHVNWTPEQWANILWTDETWITGGPHSKQYVTRRQGEEWDPTCIVEKHQRKQGWMFWGCFSGATGKGPGIFWEKDWGKINEETYRQHTVPIIDGWITLCRRDDGEELLLMQDGAPGHAAKATREDLAERGVEVIHWPPFLRT